MITLPPIIDGAQHIRYGIRRELPALLAIEAASHAHPWGEREFTEAMRQKNCILKVFDADPKYPAREILGFVIYELFVSKMAILNFAVAPEYRRRGIGESLLRHLMGKLDVRRTRIEVLISDTDLESHLFLKSIGFLAEKIVHASEGHGGDAYLFGYEVGDFP